MGGGRPYRFRASAEELAPYEEDWDAIEDHLGHRTAWFDKKELREIYSEAFAETLEAEASRLLGVENSTLQRMDRSSPRSRYVHNVARNQ